MLLHSMKQGQAEQRPVTACGLAPTRSVLTLASLTDDLPDHADPDSVSRKSRVVSLAGQTTRNETTRAFEFAESNHKVNAFLDRVNEMVREASS